MKFPFKIGDVLVYVFIALLTAGSFAGLYLMGSGTVSSYVTVELDGTVIGTYDIPQGAKSEQVRIDAGDGRYNLMTITNQGIFIEEANCPDQICVRWGKINKPGQDRKSTRLNSSHVRISYAVFCLKKKKKFNNEIMSKFHINKIVSYLIILVLFHFVILLYYP